MDAGSFDIGVSFLMVVREANRIMCAAREGCGKSGVSFRILWSRIHPHVLRIQMLCESLVSMRMHVTLYFQPAPHILFLSKLLCYPLAYN